MRRAASVLVLTLILTGCSKPWQADRFAQRAMQRVSPSLASLSRVQAAQVLDTAIYELETAIRLNPTVSGYHCHLGILLMQSELVRTPLRLLPPNVQQTQLDHFNAGARIDGNPLCYAGRADVYRTMRPLTDANLQQSAADVQRVLSANLPSDHQAYLLAKGTQQLLTTQREREAQRQAKIAAQACVRARGVQVHAQLSQEMSATYSGCPDNIRVQSVKLPLSISEELITQARRRGVKVGFDMSLPFFQSLIDSHDSFLAPDLLSATTSSTAFRSGGGVPGHAQTDYALGFTGGESCVVQATGGEDDPRVAIPVCAVLVHINRLLRTSRFDALEQMLARYLDQVAEARTGPTAQQPTSAVITGPQ